MAITISPTQPLPGETVTITGQPSPNEGASIYVFQLTAIPPQSELTGVGQFLTTTLPGSFTTASEGPLVAPGTPQTADIPTSARAVALAAIEDNRFTPDVAGIYTWEMWEFRKYSTTNIQHVAQTTETVEVLAVLQLEISGAKRENRASVQISTDNTSVRAAEMVNESSEVARIAAASDEVQAELVRMTDQLVVDIGEDFVARVAEYQRVWDLHVANAGEHVNVDPEHASNQAAPLDVPGALDVLNKLWLLFINHTEQQGANNPPTHTNPDMAQFVNVAPATNIGQGQVLEAQLSKLYADHRRRGSTATPPIHVTANGDRANGARKSVQAAILEDVSAGTLTDYTAEANDPTVANVPVLPPVGAAWQVGDAFYFGMMAPFLEVEAVAAIPAVGTHLITWEYSDAAGTWTALPNVIDDTVNWTASILPTVFQVISWDDPGSDWIRAEVNSQGPFYYVRARVTTADPAPTTQPLLTQSYRRISPETLPRAIASYLEESITTSPAVAPGELLGAAEAASLYGFS